MAFLILLTPSITPPKMKFQGYSLEGVYATWMSIYGVNMKLIRAGATFDFCYIHLMEKKYFG